jgi:hypothetical protein
MPIQDFTKSQEQILTDLINDDNGTSFTVGMLSFGYPTPINGSKNTQVVVSVSLTGQVLYYGSTILIYNRIDLNTIPGTRSIAFNVGNAVNISDIIPAINSAYEINLTTGQYINAPLPVFIGNANQSLPFDVVADYSSLVFIGRMHLQLVRGAIPLSTVITVTALSGLVYTQPTP